MKRAAGNTTDPFLSFLFPSSSRFLFAPKTEDGSGVHGEECRECVSCITRGLPRFYSPFLYSLASSSFTPSACESFSLFLVTLPSFNSPFLLYLNRPSNAHLVSLKEEDSNERWIKERAETETSFIKISVAFIHFLNDDLLFP